MQGPSEPVQVAPSEVVLWPLVVVQARFPPLEGIVATDVMVVVLLVVVVVVIFVHVAMRLAVLPPSVCVQWVKLVEKAGGPRGVGRHVSRLPPVEAASLLDRHWWPMWPEFVSSPSQLL